MTLRASEELLADILQQSLDTLRQTTGAAAAGVWQTTSSPRVMARRDPARRQTKEPFKRQKVSLPPHIKLPTKPTHYASNQAASFLAPFLLSTTAIQNAFFVPLQFNSGPVLGYLITLNFPQWSNEVKSLVELTGHQLTLVLYQHQRLAQTTSQLEEMSDQNRQWQAIYNGVQESIVLLDSKGKVLSLNPATERITGKKAQEVIGKHIGELFPKVGLMGSGILYQGPSGLYQTLREKRPSDLFEAVVETKDKRHIWINYTYTPLWDSAGKMIALVRVTSDVSTVKAVEQMKNDFVSIASHELRTPLGVINGYLSLFLNGQLGSVTPDQQAFLERIYHSSSDMAGLVEDLLNTSRIEANRLQISLQVFDLNKLVTEVVGHLEPRYQAKRLKLQIKQPSESVIIKGDRQKIEQALTNIIDNAIKYTYPDGTIIINVKPKNDSAEIAVKDSGVGISPENLAHIFEKFYRENNPLSIKEGGSGLGLYISRKLIELHGGTVSVTSKEHQGSTFLIKFPLKTAKTHSLPQGAS